MAKYKFDWSSEKEKIKKEDENKKTFTKDERLWKPVLKDGVCSALIRFLPAQDGTTVVHYTEHSFAYTKGNQSKKYWKKCINDFGYDRECPICTKNMELYNSAFPEDKKIAQSRSRKHWYMVNIYVIKHAGRPEDEGKTFLFQMGKSVYEKLKKRMNPSDEDRQAPDYIEIFPFELYNDGEDKGADFYLTSKKQGEFENGIAMPNYEESRFMPPAPFLGGDEDKIDAVIEKVHMLDEFNDEKSYPTNEEVIRTVGHLLGILPPEEITEPEIEPDTSFFNDDAPQDDIPSFEVPETAKVNKVPEETKTNSSPPIMEEDDDAAYFMSITGKK